MTQLKELDRCWIYRDGGTLEGVWITNEDQEWVVTLNIDNPKIRELASKVNYYRLFNCRCSDIKENQQIVYGSTEHKIIIDTLNEWLKRLNNNLDKFNDDSDNRIRELMRELKRGNY